MTRLWCTPTPQHLPAKLALRFGDKLGLCGDPLFVLVNHFIAIAVGAYHKSIAPLGVPSARHTWVESTDVNIVFSTATVHDERKRIGRG